MPKKKLKKSNQTEAKELVIKRYGNRRLYNTETGGYVTYEDLIKLIREGRDIKVVDSVTSEDVTKTILIQLILEEEKRKKPILPTEFLFQLLRSREEAVQDFFKNHLAASFEAYLKTKEEFDKRFRAMLEMAATAPQIWEKLIPGAEIFREMLTGRKKEENKNEETSEKNKRQKSSK
jgi:polyhydroxyalkanoate synthesis repressor PhaR